MTEQSWNRNIKRVLSFYEELDVVKFDFKSDPQGMLDTYSSILDYNGAPKFGTSFLFLYGNDFIEMKNISEGFEAFSFRESNVAGFVHPDTFSFIFNGYHWQVYHK